MPDQVFLRYIGTNVAGARPHVAVGQLEPGARKGVGEVVRVFVELLGDLAVFRIHLHGHVGIGHDRVATHRGVGRVHRLERFGHIHGLPLPGAGGALRQFPVMIEQQFEVFVIPARRMGGPGAFEAAGNRIGAGSGSGFVKPAQALVFEFATLGLGPEQVRIAVAVGLAHRVTTGGQRHRLFVVHRHTREGFAHVAGGFQWIGLAVDAFGVHVDQAHHDRSQRVGQVADAGVAAVGAAARGQPFFLGAPVDVFFRVPDIFAAKRKAVGFQAHGFIGQRAGVSQQVRPAQLVAVLLFDRPQQAARLVQVAVIRPGIQRRKAQITRACTAATVRDTVGAGGVPGHTDHQTAVVSPVRRPPGLAVGQQRVNVLLKRRDVELLDRLAVVEVGAQRVGLGIVLVEDVEIEDLWPPIDVRRTDLSDATVHHRTLNVHCVVSPGFLVIGFDTADSAQRHIAQVLIIQSPAPFV